MGGVGTLFLLMLPNWGGLPIPSLPIFHSLNFHNLFRIGCWKFNEIIYKENQLTSWGFTLTSRDYLRLE
jgi:hypothetical protein